MSDGTEKNSDGDGMQARMGTEDITAINESQIAVEICDWFVSATDTTLYQSIWSQMQRSESIFHEIK